MKCLKCKRQLRSYGIESETKVCRFECDGEKCKVCKQRYTPKTDGICVSPCRPPNFNCDLCGKKNIVEDNYTTNNNFTLCFDCYCSNKYNFEINPPTAYSWI